MSRHTGIINALWRHPIKGFIATKDGNIVGFAVYETSRRNFFGPSDERQSLAPSVRTRRCLSRSARS